MTEHFLSPAQSLIAQNASSDRLAQAIQNDAEMLAIGLQYEVLPFLGRKDQHDFSIITIKLRTRELFAPSLVGEFDELLDSIGEFLAPKLSLQTPFAAIDVAYKTPLNVAVHQPDLGTAALYRCIPIIADFRDLLAAFHDVKAPQFSIGSDATSH